MKTYEDFQRAFKVRHSSGGYGPWDFVTVPGYEEIRFDGFYKSFNEKTKKFDIPALAVTKYLYTWGGQAEYEEVFRITGEEFDDNLTDEEMQQRLIELLKVKGPYMLKEKKL